MTPLDVAIITCLIGVALYVVAGGVALVCWAVGMVRKLRSGDNDAGR